MKRLSALVIVVLMVGAAYGQYQCDPFCGPPGAGYGRDVFHTYYSDYFTTAVGWDAFYYCSDGSTESYGTTDGAYMQMMWSSCGGGHGGTRCYEKVAGEWSLIPCP